MCHYVWTLQHLPARIMSKTSSLCTCRMSRTANTIGTITRSKATNMSMTLIMSTCRMTNTANRIEPIARSIKAATAKGVVTEALKKEVDALQGLSLGGSVVSVLGKMAIEEMALKHVKKAREHDQCPTKVTAEDLINRDTKTLTDAVLLPPHPSKKSALKTHKRKGGMVRHVIVLFIKLIYLFIG